MDGGEHRQSSLWSALVMCAWRRQSSNCRHGSKLDARHNRGRRRARVQCAKPAMTIRLIIIAAMVLLGLLTKADAEPANVRTYVLYGQGGDFMARGMKALA